MKTTNKFIPSGINLALTWYATTLCTLIFAISLLTSLTYPRNLTAPTQTHYQLYKALPAAIETLSTQDIQINKIDARELIVTNFFTLRKSPLADVAHKFIEVADQYNIDYRLLPAIAMQESQGGKKIPKESFNPFGFGIYGGQILKFESFEQAIEKLGQSLREDYINNGLKTPEQIMVKYTPPSLAKGGAWAMGVAAFMEQLR